MDFFDVVYGRRSIRKFTDRPLDAQQIETILKAAMAAPSANNYQPWEIIVVTERQMLKRLGAVRPAVSMTADAACSFAICGDKSRKRWVQDTSALTENMLLAIHAMGLGGVWCAVIDSTYNGKDCEQEIKQLLNIPKNLGVLCLVSCGYPAESREPKTYYDPKKIHWNRFGQRKE